MSRAKDIFSAPVPGIRNRDGYPAHERPLAEQYLQTLMTNTVGNTFYADQNELLLEAELLHRQIMEADPHYGARAIVYARQKGFMRLQPLYGLAHLALADRELFARAFRQTVLIPSDLADFMTIVSGMGRGQGGRTIKREAARFLNEVSEYWALKYNGRGRGYSLGDLVATIHPRPVNDVQGEIFRYVTGQKADLRLIPQIAAFEDLKRAGSDQERVAAIKAGRLPHEIVTGAVKPGREVWEAILRQLPLFALLRHLNALDRAGVLDDKREYISGRFYDREAVERSKILPFRFITAFDNVQKEWVRDVLRKATEASLVNLPDIPGRTAIFLDISGSMEGQYLKIGSVFALALFKKTQGKTIFWLFDTEVEDARPSMHDSILSQAARIKARGGTDTGAPVRRLRKHQQKVDNIILITDEQQNVGSPFYTELMAYRSGVNKDARAFIIDIAPYRSALVPSADRLTSYIYGWSDVVLQYIAAECAGYRGMVEEVAAMDLG